MFSVYHYRSALKYFMKSVYFVTEYSPMAHLNQRKVEVAKL